MSQSGEFRLLWSRTANDILEIRCFELRFYTYFRGQAGRLVFRCLPGDVYTIHPEFSSGQLVTLWQGDKAIWRGRIFSAEFDGWCWEVLCYDQLRYLLNKDSRVFYHKRPDQIISSFVAALGLTAGDICQVPYTLPLLVCQGQSCLDTIDKALSTAEQALSRRYLFYDRAGSLRLVALQDTGLDIILSSKHNLLSFQAGRSIEKEVYNEVKLTQYPADSPKYRSYTVQDREKLQSWGRLRYFAKVDRELNTGQVQSEAKAILASGSKELETLRLISPGDISCLAGFRPFVYIPELDINAQYLIEAAEHIISGDQGYIMRLDCVS
jgi:hypothetical protein